MTISQALEMAMTAHRAGRMQEAESVYRQILQHQPNNADALHLLGVLAQQCGQPQPAVELMEKSLAINPNNSAALTNLGEAYRVTGRLENAQAVLQKSLSLNPNSAEAIGNLGIVFSDMGKTDEAVNCYNRSLALNPNQPQVLNNLGNASLSRTKYDEALAIYERALRLDPKFADGHNNRGSALEHLARLEEAFAAYTHAVELNPNFAIACNNAGNVARRLCQWDLAVQWCSRSLQINPSYEPARWNIGLIELTRGDYAAGLPKYELRFVATPQRLPAGLDGQRWDGGAIDGKTILLYAEQGLGDGWQAARYVPMLADRGAKVIIECHPSQVGIMRSLRGVIGIVPYGQPRPKYDLFDPMMSLPLRFQTRLESIPREFPYITVDPERVAAWRDRLGSHTELRVGLVWRGSDNPDPLRSITLEELAPLAAVSNVQFFGLQFGEAVADIAKSAAWSKMIDLSAEVADFGETAACMMNLDLVLSIDTAAAHLAGALARPAWTLLPISPDWRWLLDREDSPWYPSMRLFRQTKRKVWTDVIERVAVELASLASRGTADRSL
jgi:tetratricopeptide (TPR) repeat protein